MRFFSDVQIHSKWSRACSKNADIDHIALWARKKGITVVGTGDFTHPAWLAEIREKLQPAEPGLYELRPDIRKRVDGHSPAACRDAPVRFMLEVEISTIYKKWDKVRKVHHLLFAPDLEAADKLVADLSKIGNLKSDGRPILGLDSRDLLEITLESSPYSYLIPAHIWTPWFAAMGSKSGFDRIEDCYGDLAGHIFAVETGLSSDPAMNWRLSRLDQYRLVSNSDAHSPPKIGREATFYDCEPDYFAMLNALKTGEGFSGTVEFFPEEGKYHEDGHRKCNVRFTPEETRAHDGICPVCGNKLTVGVLHRIDSLADRTHEEALANPPPKAAGVLSLVPLPEILAEIEGVGVNSKRVQASYGHLLSKLGTELHILECAPHEDIEKENPVLAEAVSRLRRGDVIRESGYDGEYGVIRMFEEQELKNLTRGGLLFDFPEEAPEKEAAPEKKESAIAARTGTGAERAAPGPRSGGNDGNGLDPDQRQAIETISGPLLIAAGPGSGKTRTLTHRIAHMVKDCGVPAQCCLAVTFTRRAALEMKERLEKLLPGAWRNVHIHTFHSLALAILKARGMETYIADEAQRRHLLMETLDMPERKAGRLLQGISRAKRTATDSEGLRAYRHAMDAKGWIDFDDLIAMAIQILETDPEVAESYTAISIDEYQDVDAQQYRLVRLLAPEPDSSLCVIGDPDQAIYGFRGGDARFFAAFHKDYPDAPALHLTRNYRSGEKIVTASAQVISAAGAQRKIFETVRNTPEKIAVHNAVTDKAEAEFIIKTIERLIGGHSFFSLDSGRGTGEGASDYGFSDFAVFYRTEGQSEALTEAFERSGMPFLKYANNRLIDRPEVKALAASLAGGEELEDIPDKYSDFTEQLYTRCGKDTKRFLQELRFATEADTWDPRADRIALMTIHAAKGLEFPVVFLPGLEDGILPLHWGNPRDVDMEEERRLLYVGMTRARDLLFLSHARKRLWRGTARAMPPSPFLADIERALLTRSQTDLKTGQKEEAEQLTLFG